MGIQGLLPLLRSIEKPVHLKDYAGQTLAIDGYVWLHKGAFACAQELCLGQVTQKYDTIYTTERFDQRYSCAFCGIDSETLFTCTAFDPLGTSRILCARSTCSN